MKRKNQGALSDFKKKNYFKKVMISINNKNS